VRFSAPFEVLWEGQTFTTRGRTVTEADVVNFAALSGDRHPQHTDAQWASDSPFGERIAHAMLVISLAAGLVPFDPERVVALRRVGDVVFKRPVRFGDTVHVRGRLTELADAGAETGIVAFTWTVVNQRDETVCRARVEVLWRRDVARDEETHDVTNGFVPIPL